MFKKTASVKNMDSDDVNQDLNPETQIRILRIIARMNVGGPAVEISTLCEGLSHERFRQLLLYGNCSEDEIDFIVARSKTFEFIQVPSLGRSISPMQDLKAFIHVRRIIKRFKPHIVHTHTAKAGVIGRLAALSTLGRRQLFHTYHGHLFIGYFSTPIVKTIEGIEKFFGKFTDVLISVGSEVRDDFLRRGILAKSSFEVIRPGFELAEFEEASSIRSQLGLNDSDFVVCWIGRFAPVKRPDRVLEIARGVRNRKQIHFLMVGEGDLYTSVRESSRLEDLKISFLGWRSDIPNILKSCNLLILTSENEGTPIVLIEAQASALPVIATNVGSVGEVVEDSRTGFVLDYTPEKFVDAICSLVDQPKLYDEMSSRAQVFVRQNFSASMFIERHAQLYAIHAGSTTK